MFTGIIEALGSVERLVRGGAGGGRLAVRAPADMLQDLAVGESIAVSGVCLTAVELGPTSLACDLAEETLRVTTLGGLRPGDPVNLERPLRLGGRLGGHLVLGHVDGVGQVTAVEAEGSGRRIRIAVPAGLRPLLIPKGSVAVDGVSLTVAEIVEEGVDVALIPHTLAVTTLGARGVGARVNLEVDVIGKYVRALLPAGEAAREFLARHGLAVPAGEA